MENIPRDLAKEITALQSLKPTRKNRRWTLLLMGDHGKVVTIRWFRWIAALSVLLLVLAVIAATMLYFLYRRGRDVNARLQRSLAQIQQEISGLRQEKDLLTAQVAVARVELEKLTAKTGAEPVHAAGLQKPSEGPGEMPAPAAEIARGSPAKADGAAAATAAPEGVPKVAIEELTISHEAHEQTYRVEFMLKNTGPESEPVSGYTAVVLKAPNLPPDAWLCLPAVKLAAGVPTGRKKGQYFSIARFKNVRSEAKSKLDPGRFNMATVFVFDTRENLLLQKEYAIDIEKSVFTPVA